MVAAQSASRSRTSWTLSRSIHVTLYCKNKFGAGRYWYLLTIAIFQDLGKVFGISFKLSLYVAYPITWYHLNVKNEHWKEKIWLCFWFSVLLSRCSQGIIIRSCWESGTFFQRKLWQRQTNTRYRRYQFFRIFVSCIQTFLYCQKDEMMIHDSWWDRRNFDYHFYISVSSYSSIIKSGLLMF